MKLAVSTTYENGSFSYENPPATGLRLIGAYYFVIWTYEDGLSVGSGILRPYEFVTES